MKENHIIMKRVVTIQDISCFGKCSLTVALPVISAMGIETAVIPTAVLSTHTGKGFSNYTFRDLTEDIPAVAAHWKSMDLKFNGIYTGYLGSKQQVHIVEEFCRDFGTDDNFIVIDPVMGDGGQMYAGFTDEFVAEMRKLCSKADYILPNLTEASLLLDMPYPDKYDKAYVEDTLRGLAGLGCSTPVLTGVCLGGDKQGAAAYDSANDRFIYSFGKNIDRTVHGTGDIFASVFTGAVALGKSLDRALDISVRYTLDCIEATEGHFEEVWYGSCFELALGKLIGYVKE